MFWGLVTRGEWFLCINIAVRRKNEELSISHDSWSGYFFCRTVLYGLRQSFKKPSYLLLIWGFTLVYWCACSLLVLLQLYVVKSGCLNSCMQSAIAENQARRWKCLNSFPLNLKVNWRQPSKYASKLVHWHVLHWKGQFVLSSVLHSIQLSDNICNYSCDEFFLNCNWLLG